ncbi:MAG: metallophosphoesterase, partial [Archangium sp.]|nr:metallophosphoesterase [Archangium sp.]
LSSIVLYVYRRMVRDVVQQRWLRAVGAVTLVALLLSFPLVRFVAGNSTPPTVAVTLLSVVGLVLFTFLPLLVLDATRWFATRGTKPELVDPKRRLFLSRAVAAGALGVGGTTASLGLYRAFTPPEITEVPIKLAGLPKALDGLTIVQLTDIHVGSIIQEKFLDMLVTAANSARPDVVAITGDLVDGPPDRLGQYVARLANMHARYGKYFCSGNHDYYSGWESWAKVLPGLGFRVLRNERVSIGDAGASFDLLGVEDWGAPRFGASDYDLEAATAGRDLERASVLMAHQPQNLDAVAEKKIGLQISGHTHGGQIFPGTIVASLAWGAANEGLSRHNGTWQYTSRGCGFVAVPMRVGAPPQIVKLVLTT